MSNTYYQIYIHAIFTVQNRVSLIADGWRERLNKYICGIVQNNGHKLLAVGAMPDHVHLFFGLSPAQSVSDLMQDVKGNSSRWINENGLVDGRFAWQEGYGAFSYSRSQIDTVIKYINNQPRHHKRKTFIEEYKDFLKAFEIEYDEKYIFKPVK